MHPIDPKDEDGEMRIFWYAAAIQYAADTLRLWGLPAASIRTRIL
jgi:hypothetical protein